MVADPAHSAFDRSVMAEVKVGLVPDHGFDRAAHHRAAARQVDQLDLMGSAIVGKLRLLARKAVTILGPTVAAAARLALYRNAVKRVGLGALRLLGDEDGFLDGAAENLRPDIHHATPYPSVRDDAPRMVTESCT